MSLSALPNRPQRRSADARDLLLDTAERLFSEKGFFGASVRDITDAAGLRLASVNYHFGSKDHLLAAVVGRRAKILKEERLSSLAEALALDLPVEARLAAIARAFVSPMIARRLDGGEGWKRYFVLMAHLNALPHAEADAQADDFDAVARAYIAALQGLSPNVSAFRAHAAFQFMLGTALFVVCDNRRLDHLSGGRFHSNDLAALTEPLTAFLAGGARACLET